jgi:hypothetical protein
MLRQPFWDIYVGVPVYSVSQKSRDNGLSVVKHRVWKLFAGHSDGRKCLGLNQGSSVSRSFSVTGQILSKEG